MRERLSRKINRLITEQNVCMASISLFRRNTNHFYLFTEMDSWDNYSMVHVTIYGGIQMHNYNTLQLLLL